MSTIDETAEIPLRGTAVRPRARRLHGLKLTTVPAIGLLGQWVGAAAALGGVYLQWGLAASLMIGGAAAVVLGMLHEGGKL